LPGLLGADACSSRTFGAHSNSSLATPKHERKTLDETTSACEIFDQKFSLGVGGKTSLDC